MKEKLEGKKMRPDALIKYPDEDYLKQRSLSFDENRILM